MEEFYPEPDDQSQVTEPSEDGYGSETALIPKSMLGEKQPGDRCEIEIVGVFEDEYEVSVAEKAEATEPSEMPMDAKIDMAAV